MSDNMQLMTKEVSYAVAGGETVRLTGSMVKSYLTRGNGKVTDQELVLFMNLCKYQQLNPFLNEAYLVKYSDSTPANIVVGKEAFMKRAEDHPSYDGFRAGIIIERDKKVLELEGCFSLKTDILLGGWCEVYRKDRTHPIRETVAFAEYDKNQSTWKTMPKTMIRKVAIVQALREAFPNKLGDLYVEDEYIEMTPQQEVDVNANQEEFIVEEQSEAAPIQQQQEPNGQQMQINEPVHNVTNKRVPF